MKGASISQLHSDCPKLVAIALCDNLAHIRLVHDAAATFLDAICTSITGKTGEDAASLQ